MFSSSAVTKQVGSAYDAYENKTWANRGASSTSCATSELNSFNSLSSSDQDIIAYVRKSVGGDGTADGYRQYLEASVSKSIELDARIAKQMKYQSAGGTAAYVRTGATAGTKANASSTAPSADSESTAAPQTDADKALAILKAYTAGQTTQTDSDKALSALKENAAGKSDNDAALLILKNATAKTTAAQHPATSAASKTASTAKQTSGETGTATDGTHNTTGSAISLTA